MQINKINKNKGFTLIEILVATFIFMIIMVAAIGALVSVSNSAKKAKALRAAMDNVNYAMDNMSRSLRVGSNYYCSSSPSIFFPIAGFADCTSIRGTSLAFKPVYHSAIDTSFELDGGQIIKASTFPSSYSRVSLTAPEVEITELAFYVKGSDPATSPQPSVFMRVKGKVTISGEVTEFSLQNYVSQRNLE